MPQIIMIITSEMGLSRILPEDIACPRMAPQRAMSCDCASCFRDLLLELLPLVVNPSWELQQFVKQRRLDELPSKEEQWLVEEPVYYHQPPQAHAPRTCLLYNPVGCSHNVLLHARRENRDSPSPLHVQFDQFVIVMLWSAVARHLICCSLEVWAFLLFSRCFSSLSCVNEYLAVVCGGNVSEWFSSSNCR